MFDGFVRLCAATPALEVANVEKNAAEIARLALEAAAQGANVCVFPELCLTGYTCGDLFLHDRLVRGALEGLKAVLDKTREVDMLIIVGLPVADGNCLYNCAAVLQGGHVLGVVPKTHLPNYAEFYELRQFAPAFEGRRALHWFGEEVPFAADLLFACRELPEFVVGVEICEDLWAPLPTGVKLALAGATVLVNPSASDALAGKRDYRRELVSSQSARLAAAYVYAGAGPDESTQDVVFAGHSLICEYGSKLAESEPFYEGLLFADADVGFLALERRANNDFREGAGEACGTVSFSQPLRALELRRFIDPAPFIPHDPDHLSERAEELLSIQAHGLARRLRHTHAQKLVLGVSGGLDSTLALLVCVRALKLAGMDAGHLTAVTMPCFGTTQRTRSNAEVMAREVGADFRVIDIQKATLQHMSDIGLSVEDRSTAYENAQARERTQVLMDIANAENGLVVGTGDLSESALGWATYNGDHMSMYGVNCSIPKTLIRHLVAYEASRAATPALQKALLDVLDTPVSPELLPPKDGEIAQKTEDLVGPYRLHDFFLYHMLRRRAAPEKILRLAKIAFAGEYGEETIRKWLTVFTRRFFQQQFKRSCIPDGPKVGSVSLSPRGDWRMPTDAAWQLWRLADK